MQKINAKIEFNLLKLFFLKVTAISLVLIISAGVVLGAGDVKTAKRKTVKLLTIGNSFADNAVKYLAKIAQKQGDTLVLGRANLGGCPMDRHWDNFTKNVKIYKYKKKKYSLKEMFKMKKWDVVTIQQLSWKSYERNTYEPYAGNLIANIKKYAPQAEIVVHQTWAYRIDHPFFVKKGATLNQEKMFKDLTENYIWLAGKYNLRIFPSGTAMQTCREKQPVKYKFPDSGFNYKKPQYPKLPNQDGSMIIGWRWRKDKNGKTTLRLDGIHANVRGEYLQGCLWYEMLFGKNCENVKYIPQGISAKDAAFLRKIAHATAVGFKQVKK